MKKRITSVILLTVGLVPFIAPFAVGLYRMSIESWTMSDWLIMYSYIYWPTYLIGAVMLVLSLVMLLRGRER